MKNYYFCSECDNTVEFGHECLVFNQSRVIVTDQKILFDTVDHTSDPPSIQELRHRVAKANELSGGYDNVGNHRLGQFLDNVLREYDLLKRDENRLDWLEKQGNGNGWISRQSDTDRGYRLHNTTRTDAQPTARAAIDYAMQLYQETQTQDVYPDLLDDDGYPTEYALHVIETWGYEKGYIALMNFIRDLWWAPDFGWSVPEQVHEKLYGDLTVYNISTAGWSGNESIIAALQENHMFWVDCWYSSRRGGHYTFKVRRKNSNATTRH